ncbi:MAG: V-type ATP synthase subunit F [Clostridia bacterium]|nr:V-type ATP synthase subunit F [Clostridia bacterium]
MSKIGVIGDRDTVLVFGALGMTVFSTDDFREASRKIAALVKEGYSIVFITEPLAAEMEQVFDQYKNNPDVALIIIPNNSGSTGVGLANIKKSVEKAIGADILK